MHLTYRDTCDTTYYSAPVVFDRNSQRVSPLVRVVDLLWSLAGLSTLYESAGSSVGVSVYSLPLTLVDRVGGWDVDDGAITEDFHMYIKCSLALKGNMRTRIVHSPVSSTNLPSNGSTFRGVIGEIAARYVLAVRYWWGSLDIGYALRLVAGILWGELSRPKKITVPMIAR
jgi:Glycosyl transferase family group 2